MYLKIFTKVFFSTDRKIEIVCVFYWPVRIIQTFISIPKPTAIKPVILQQEIVTFASFYVIYGNKAVKIVKFVKSKKDVTTVESHKFSSL